MAVHPDDKSLFRDPLPASTTAAIALAAGIVLDLWALAWVLPRIQEGALVPDLPWQTFHYIARLSTVGAMLMWTDRVYANVVALHGIADMSRIWATISWFIPPFCFYRPCQIVLEASGSGARQDDGMRRGIAAWWVLFLVAPLVVIASGQAPKEVRSRRAATAHAINVVSASIAIFVVRGVSKSQKEAHQREVRAAVAAAKRERALEAVRLAQAAAVQPAGPRIEVQRPASPALPPGPFIPPVAEPVPFFAADPDGFEPVQPSAAYSAAAPRVPAVRPVIDLQPAYPAVQQAMRVRTESRPLPPRPPAQPKRPDARDVLSRAAESCESHGALIGAWTGAVVALATLAAALRTPLDAAEPVLLRAGVQAAFGLLLLGAFLLLGMKKRDAVPETPVGILGVLLVIAILNLVSLSGAILK